MEVIAHLSLKIAKHYVEYIITNKNKNEHFF